MSIKNNNATRTRQGNPNLTLLLMENNNKIKEAPWPGDSVD